MHEDGQDRDSSCLVQFARRGAAVELSTSTGEACSAYCGVRAAFTGTYLVPPAGCKPKERAARREAFARQYRAHDFAKALATLTALQQQCGRFFNWLMTDDLRNDLAVTLNHLNRKSECLAVLEPTRGAKARDAQALGEELPWADLEAYLPVAKATWHNLRLCAR